MYFLFTMNAKRTLIVSENLREAISKYTEMAVSDFGFLIKFLDALMNDNWSIERLDIVEKITATDIEQTLSGEYRSTH